MMYMNTSRNKANRLNYESLFSFTFANITGPSKLPHGNVDTPFDGSKLNTDSIENFYIIIISCNSPFNICHIILEF